jgi:hypothetical protein
MAVSANELVFAIAHEVGNHLGAIRLQSHLLDEDLSAVELARACVLMDGLAGSAGSLLSLLRPLLTERKDARVGREVDWQSVLAAVRQQIIDDGTHGTELVVDEIAGSSERAPTVGWLHPLLVAMVGATVTHVSTSERAPGRVELVLDVRAEGDVLWIIDDGDEESLEQDAALRGRPLAVAIGACLLDRWGGRVETERDDAGRTRVGLVFAPAVTGPQAAMDSATSG